MARLIVEGFEDNDAIKQSIADAMAPEPTERIAELNDLARTAMGVATHVVMTPRIAAMSAENRSAIREAVEKFDDFTPDNDAYGEHDFGGFDFKGTKILWKIDYYNRTLDAGSEDPSNPAVTQRVLTIMQADEC
jgi:hypothetical protein